MSIRLHRYEMESLAAASVQGCRDLLGHRPASDVEALRLWMLTRLTMRKTSSGRSKLSLDRTIVKEVRKLPPHGSLMILHAVRIPGKGRRKGAGVLMIIGHNPITQSRMTMIPDEMVMEHACGHPALEYIFRGPERHREMRRLAERIISQLVVMERNGKPTLSHIKMRWVQEALERAANAKALLVASREREMRARALRIALAVKCQRVRMLRYRLGVLADARGCTWPVAVSTRVGRHAP